MARILKKSKVRRWIENSLLGAGILALAAWLWSVVGLAVSQNWENWVFEREIHGQPAGLVEYVAEGAKNTAERVRIWLGISGVPTRLTPHHPAGPRAPGPSFIDKDGLVGRLTIPRLHLRATVREGADERMLRLALGHIRGTALPGQGGNVGVAGHRDTLFRALREIQKNDLIQFETLSGEYVYKVEKTEIVSPRQVSVLNAGRYPELTLVTCYPFQYIGSAPKRFIVEARQLAGNPIEEPAKAQEGQPAAAVEPAEPGERGAGPNPPAGSEQRSRDRSAMRVAFEVMKNHSRQLAPGILIGLTATDVPHRRVTGWIWLMPDRRTIWIRNRDIQEPLIFYGYVDGRQRELVITNVAENSVNGYLVLPRDRMDPVSRASVPQSRETGDGKLD